MQGAAAKFAVDRVEGGAYQPEMIDGTQVGEFRQIEPNGSSANRLDVSLWRSDPATYDYLFEGDEAFHVVEERPRSSFPTAARRSSCGPATSLTSSPAPDRSGRSPSRSRSSS